jgi:hypothetical protein
MSPVGYQLNISKTSAHSSPKSAIKAVAFSPMLSPDVDGAIRYTVIDFEVRKDRVWAIRSDRALALGAMTSDQDSDYGYMRDSMTN